MIALFQQLEQGTKASGMDTAKHPSRLPVWALALSTTLGMQSVASFLDQSLSVVAPLLTASMGLAPERVGNLSSLSALGVVLFLLFGGPILRRLGPVRMLQVGALIAVCGLAVASTGWWPLLAVAGVMMGLGYGPSPPAGSRILAATAPPRHRSLIFSIKQAGAPLGGALAGLILAPAAALWGWQGAVLIAMAIGLAAAAAIQPTYRRLNVERDATRAINFRVLFDPAKVIAPFRALGESRDLVGVTCLAVSFAIVQGALFSFTVTYLTVDRGLALVAAGTAFATMQFAGVAARIILGWLADRTGTPAINLGIQALLAAAAVVAFGSLPPDVSLRGAALVGALTGFFAASWNGIYLAEISRLSPADRIAELTASSTALVFVGYVIGPTLFSLLVSAIGNYTAPFCFIAGQLALVATVHMMFLRRDRRLQSEQRT